MNEFITGTSTFRASDREIDHQGPAYDVGPRYKSPIAAVQAIVAIVAHYKIMVWRHDEFAAVHVIRQLITPMAVDVPRIAALVGKVVAISIRHPLLVHRVIFLERAAVDENNLVAKPDMVSGHSNHPFHQK